jgi:subtilisin family serine protease
VIRPAALVLLLTLGVAVSGSPVRAAPPGAATLEPQRPLIVVTFANTPSQPAVGAGTTARRYAGSGYQIAARAQRQAQRVAAAYSLKEVANWPIRALSVHCVVYEITDGRPIAPILTALSKDPRVSLAQPLQQFHTLTQGGAQSSLTPASPASTTPPTAVPPPPYNDPLYDLQTNLASLGIASAHERSQGSGVRIALIDTGVDVGHPDLRARIAGTRSFVPRRAESAASYRHGTAMAGLIAATANNRVGIVGIAPLATIEVYEACWQLQPDSDEAACNTFTLAEAISAALDGGAPLVNLSVAGPQDPLLTALIGVGLKRGVIFVGAAEHDPDAFPTGIAGVIGVASSEHELGRPLLTAPGVHVLTLRPRAQYDFESGSSVATAEVTGIIALLLATDRRLTGAPLEALLRQTAGPSMQASAADVMGASVVNVNAALSRIAQESGDRLARSR